MKSKTIEVTPQELDDLLSGLSFFIRTFPGGAKENPKTMKAMEKLSKKLWKVVKSK